MTPSQFDALQNWIVAEIEARAVRNSSGPHVRVAQDHAHTLSVIARYALTGELISDPPPPANLAPGTRADWNDRK